MAAATAAPRLDMTEEGSARRLRTTASGACGAYWLVAGEPGDRAERSAEADDPWNLNRIMPAEGALRNREVAEAIERGSAVWGIRPVPDDRRLLRGLDVAVLWGDLS